MKDRWKAKTQAAVDPEGESISRERTSVSTQLVARAVEHLEGLTPHERAFIERELRRRLRVSAHLRVLLAERVVAQRLASSPIRTAGGTDAS